MKTKSTVVSIGISAFNEGSNIKKLIQSILDQKEQDYYISEIFIYSDGSTDDTASQVRSIDDPRILFKDDKNRIGKSARLNEIFHRATGDIIVLFDADIILSSQDTIANLIKPLVAQTKIGLVGGNPQPVKAKTFVEEAINTTFHAYDPLRTRLRGGNNIYGCDGRILALTKKFASLVHVPGDTIANDAYLYFSCLSKGFEYRHIRNAVVWFRSPSTVRDQIRQNKRFVAAHTRMERYFGTLATDQ
jgi:glycosyltransferase involved in cell wall biosynthesis